MLKPKPYIKLASAEFADCRIERIFIKARWTEAIRLSDWRGARFNRRALVMPEDDLLVLLAEALGSRVFSEHFRTYLSAILIEQSQYAPQKSGESNGAS